MQAMRWGEMFPHRTLRRRSGFFWSFRLEIRLRRRDLYFISVDLNSWKICGHNEQSRTKTLQVMTKHTHPVCIHHMHLGCDTALSSSSLWIVLIWLHVKCKNTKGFAHLHIMYVSVWKDSQLSKMSAKFASVKLKHIGSWRIFGLESKRIKCLQVVQGYGAYFA